MVRRGEWLEPGTAAFESCALPLCHLAATVLFQFIVNMSSCWRSILSLAHSYIALKLKIQVLFFPQKIYMYGKFIYKLTNLCIIFRFKPGWRWTINELCRSFSSFVKKKFQFTWFMYLKKLFLRRVKWVRNFESWQRFGTDFTQISESCFVFKFKHKFIWVGKSFFPQWMFLNFQVEQFPSAQSKASIKHFRSFKLLGDLYRFLW